MTKQILLAAMIATGLALAPAAFADDMMKPGATKSSMDKKKSDAMNKKDGMKKSDGMMKSDGMSKSDGMKKDGMSK